MVKMMAKKSETRAGEALRELMKERSVSQTELATQLDVSQAYVSSIVRGTKNMSPSTIDKAAGVLGASDHVRVRLHRAAALDQGFHLDLPDDF